MQTTKSLGYCNGEFGTLDSLTVPFLDRALYFGDGVYDATIACDGVILYEKDHIDRFFNSAALIRLELPFSKEELAQILQELVDRFDEPNTFLYWQVTRGAAPRAHAFPAEAKPTVMAYIVEHPRENLSIPLRGHFVEDTRFYHCNAKTLNLLPNVLAMQEAKEAGCDEAIFMRDGYVTECAHSNVHILKDHTLITHPADNLILPGIARKHLIAMAEKLDIPVEERGFTVAELLDADEVIMSASSTFAKPFAWIDDAPVGGKDPETLHRLQTALTAEFEEYIATHKRG